MDNRGNGTPKRGTVQSSLSQQTLQEELSAEEDNERTLSPPPQFGNENRNGNVHENPIESPQQFSTCWDNENATTREKLCTSVSPNALTPSENALILRENALTLREKALTPPLQFSNCDRYRDENRDRIGQDSDNRNGDESSTKNNYVSKLVNTYEKGCNDNTSSYENGYMDSHENAHKKDDRNGHDPRQGQGQGYRNKDQNGPHHWTGHGSECEDRKGHGHGQGNKDQNGYGRKLTLLAKSK